VHGPHSGYFRSDGEVCERVDRSAGQKEWTLKERCQLPPFANEIINKIITDELLGSGQQLWYAPKMSMDAELSAFQKRHQIVVPLMLRQKSDKIVSVDMRRAKREIKSQFDALVRAQAELMLSREAADQKQQQQQADDDDGSYIERDDAVENANLAEQADAQVGDQGDQGNPSNQINPGEIASVELGQNVVRRLLTTLMHDLYMLRIVDPLDLCCATYLNLHGLKEARGTYNCLEAMFVDYDDDGQSHWRNAVEKWDDFLKSSKHRVAKKFNKSVVSSFEAVVERAHKVHHNIERHARFHNHHYPALCPIGSCSVDLTNRPFAKLHTCMTKVHSIVLAEKLEANDM